MIKCLQPKLLFSCTELFQVRPLSNVGSSARSSLLKRRSSENWLTLWLCVAEENNCSHQIKELAVVMKCEKISQKFNRIVLQNLPWKKTKVIKFWVFFVVVFSLFFYICELKCICDITCWWRCCMRYDIQSVTARKINVGEATSTYLSKVWFHAN